MPNACSGVIFFLGMRVLFLGSGTSTGVPAIGCRCAVCTSTDPHNKRLRASVLVTEEDKNLLIDTATDLRQQALLYGITRVDAVIYTHDHADHLHGIDELRAFNFIQWRPIPVYGNPKTIQRIRDSFGYIFDGNREGGGKPLIELHEINGRFEAAGVPIEPLLVWHGSQQILGFRIADFAYLTDASRVPPETIEAVRGVEVVVLDALQQKEHPTHMNFDQAIAVANEIGAKRTLLTHMAHKVDHETTNASLPKGIELAYDGLEIIIERPKA